MNFQISTTIAVMIPMNQLTCAVNVTVLPVGNDALASQTIDAFRNGCSAMARTIVVITGETKIFSFCSVNSNVLLNSIFHRLATNWQKIAQSAIRKPISNARTIDAFPSKFSFEYSPPCLTFLNSQFFFFPKIFQTMDV